MSTSSYMPGFPEPWLQGSLVSLDLEKVTPDTVAKFDMAGYANPDGPINPFGPSGWGRATGHGFVTARMDRPEVVWRDADGTLRQIRALESGAELSE
jgi:hypothetical protein